jgi:branched-chain amino acid transport system permease protein
MTKFPFRSTWILGSAGIIITVIPTILIHFNIIDAYVAQVLTSGGIGAIMAMSANMIIGITGQLSIGQAGFMTIGAFGTISLAVDLGLPLPLAALVAALIAAFFGFIIGFPVLKLSGDYLAIVTLGFGEIIRVVFVNLKPITGGAGGRQFVTGVALYSDLGYFIVVAALVIILALLQNFLRSSYGRAILAVREDEIAANSNGIDIFKYKMVGFVTASFIAGIAGALYAMKMGFVKPDMAGWAKSIDYNIFVVLGGMGSMTGSILAALVLTCLQEFLRFLQDFRLLIYPLILIFVMIFRPQGLMGLEEFSLVGTWDKLTRRFGKGVKQEADVSKGKGGKGNA